MAEMESAYKNTKLKYWIFSATKIQKVMDIFVLKIFLKNRDFSIFRNNLLYSKSLFRTSEITFFKGERPLYSPKVWDPPYDTKGIDPRLGAL